MAVFFFIDTSSHLYNKAAKSEVSELTSLYQILWSVFWLTSVIHSAEIINLRYLLLLVELKIILLAYKFHLLAF